MAYPLARNLTIHTYVLYSRSKSYDRFQQHQLWKISQLNNIYFCKWLDVNQFFWYNVGSPNALSSNDFSPKSAKRLFPNDPRPKMLFGEKSFGETSFRGILGKSCLGKRRSGNGRSGNCRGTIFSGRKIEPLQDIGW
jgi:hypothetical protein